MCACCNAVSRHASKDLTEFMRIAFFLGRFPVISETFILRQITSLIDDGHEVDMYAEVRPATGEPVHEDVQRYKLWARTLYFDLPSSAVMEMPIWPLTAETWLPGSSTPVRNFRIAAAGIPSIVRSFVASPRLTIKALTPSEYGYQAASLSTVYRIAKLSRCLRSYDVLHAHFGPVGNTFRFARELFQAPLVVSFHGYDFTSWPRQHGRTCYDRLWPTADLITVNSEFARQSVHELGCPCEKIKKLPVGLNPDEFPFRERRLQFGDCVRLLTVARLVEQKGHRYALEALAKVRDSYPAIEYTIVGEGPTRSSLMARIEELGLSRNVVLVGARTQAQVRQLMADSHIFVLPAATPESGDTEGQGLVLQEAQACGLPVIATRHGAIPEGILDGLSGFLVPQRDVQALATAIIQLIHRHEHWGDMGRCGHDFATTHYDQRKLNCELQRLYLQARSSFPGD